MTMQIFSFLSADVYVYSDKNMKKYLQVWPTCFLTSPPYWMFVGPLYQIKLHLLSTVLLSGFQSFGVAFDNFLCS